MYKKHILTKDSEGFENEFVLGGRKLVRAKIYTNKEVNTVGVVIKIAALWPWTCFIEPFEMKGKHTRKSGFRSIVGVNLTLLLWNEKRWNTSHRYLILYNIRYL